jgi:hypothetical protein
MLTTRRVVLLLRLMLVAAFLAVLLLQVLSVPGSLAHQAEQDPSFADARWVVLVVVELVLLCGQVVIVATWRLLGMVAADRIFTDEAFRWVDLIIGAIGVAWLVWASVTVWVMATSDEPGTPLAFGITVLAGAVFGLLMLVMRALLRQATTLRTDMDAVI